MQLIIIWHNATRTKTEKTKVEDEAKIYILDAFVSMEKALHYHNVHYSIAYEHPNTEWGRILKNAFTYATRNLSPWEREHSCFSAKFVPR